MVTEPLKASNRNKGYQMWLLRNILVEAASAVGPTDPGMLRVNGLHVRGGSQAPSQLMAQPLAAPILLPGKLTRSFKDQPRAALLPASWWFKAAVCNS